MRTRVQIACFMLLLLVVACGPSVPPSTPTVPPLATTAVIDAAADVSEADSAEDQPAAAEAETDIAADAAAEETTGDADEAMAEADDSTAEEMASDEPVEGADAFPETRPAIRAQPGTQETYGDGIEVGFTEDGHPYIGSIDKAPVIIEEFSDFQCPFCGRFYQQTLGSLLSAEIANGEAALVFYDFPLSFHAQAAAAAGAARCAGEQGAAAYWQMHDEIFATLGQWSVADPSPQFISYAGKIGVDTEAFSQCIAEDRYAEEVQADLANGQQRGIRGTPGFIINGEALSGAQPYQAFQAVIARAKTGEIAVRAPEPEPIDPSEIEIDEPEPFPLDDNFAAALGDPNAPVVVVEFTDYQCPFCGRHSSQTLPQLVEKYIDEGRIYYIMKDLPLDQIHPLARDAAAAARCAGQQDAYWEMHDLLFATQDQWGQGDIAASMRGYAESLSLDLASFDTCYADQSVRDAIEANVQEAQQIGIGGTPFFFVDGFPVINGAQPLEVFDQVIGLAEEDELVNAIMDAQRRQIAAQQQQAQQQPQQAAPPQPTGPVDVPVDNSYAIGDPNAPITIVEYTDYQCPFCARHHSQTFEQIVTEYVDEGLVYYVFKDFPLNFHPQAETASVAARCAGEQGEFLAMHNKLFGSQGEWSGRPDAAAIFAGYAADMQLDVDAFASCQANDEILSLVRADFNEGGENGVRGTPAFFINGQLISGAQPFESFQQYFNAALAE